MKVTVTDREVKKSKYPYVGISSDQIVVLFIGDSTGMVLEDNDARADYKYVVGHCDDNWDEKDFTPLVNKTITIEV